MVAGKWKKFPKRVSNNVKKHFPQNPRKFYHYWTTVLFVLYQDDNIQKYLSFQDHFKTFFGGGGDFQHQMANFSHIFVF